MAALRYLAGVSALAIAYYASGLIGLSLFDVGATALIWFPSAIALAVFVLYGVRYLPAVVLGSVVLAATRGLSLRVELILIVTNVLETSIGALLLVRVMHIRPQLDRVRDAVAFATVAIAVSSLGATVSTLLFHVFGVVPVGLISQCWSTWWWSHLGGELVVTPAILTVACHSPMPRRRQGLGLLEAFVLALAGFGLVLAILARWLPPLFSLATPPYYVLPMLLWAGLRFGPRGAALASLSTNVVAIVAQAIGVGPFVGLLDLQSFVTISTVGTLMVSTLAIERMNALQMNETTWRYAHDRLEAVVVQRTEELTAANQALAQRDQLMRQAAALAHLGSFETDLVSHRTVWSDELYAIVGRDPEHFKPSLGSLLATVTPADRRRVEEQIRFGIKNGGTFQLTAHIKRPDDGERTLQVLVSVETDDKSRPIRIVGCCQDITEREHAEHHRAQLAQLVESSDDAIMGLTPTGKIKTWNFGAEQVFGYSASEVIGNAFSDLVAPHERERTETVLAAIRGGEHIAHHYAYHVRKNGEVFPASVTTSGVLDGECVVIGISKVIRDITNQQEVEAQLRASLHEKEVLLREIHHRVKNNLQVIASLLRLETATTGTAHQALVDSQNRIHSMALIHQLLYQSKDFAHVDFQQYLDNLAERLAQAFGTSPRIAISVRCTLGDQLTVDQAIPCALILNELVTNALTHGFPDNRAGNIDVSVAGNDEEVTMFVRDNGIGFDVEEARMTGMGFRIIRTLATQLGGTLKIEREEGTTATVTFPPERSSARQGKIPSASHKSPS